MGDSFYRSEDPTNSIKVLKEMLQKRKKTTKTTKYTYPQTIYTHKRIYTKYAQQVPQSTLIWGD